MQTKTEIVIISIIVLIVVVVIAFLLSGNKILTGGWCTHAAPTLVLYPESITVNSGTSAEYTALITNRDSEGCPSSIFKLTGSVSAGWSYTFSEDNFELNPENNITISYSVSSPVSAPLGNHTVTLEVKNIDSVLTDSSSVKYVSRCTDSDGAYGGTNGTVFRTKGVCQDSTGSYADVCSSNYIAHDYSCDELGECASKVGYNCGIFGLGFVCVDGMCQRQGTI